MFVSPSAIQLVILFSFFFSATSTTVIYTLSLHDALPICPDHVVVDAGLDNDEAALDAVVEDRPHRRDRKSTRLNSSHQIISYAVFCLKKKISHVDEPRLVVDQGNLRGDRGLGHEAFTFVW